MMFVYNSCIFTNSTNKMQHVWNDFELKKPPFLTLPTTHTSFVIQLHGIIETYFRKQTTHEEEFCETAALLGRLMARRKNSFNKMKGFKEICKLNAALCRLLRVDFKRDLDSFRCTLPDVEYDEGTMVHLPTRDNLDFLLLRLIAVCELYKRIVKCCIEAAEYFTIQLRVHYFFEINTLLVAVIAKINKFSIKLGSLAVHFYNNLWEYRLKLPVNEKSKLHLNSPEIPSKLEIIQSPTVKEQKTVSTKSVHKPIDEEQTISDFLREEQQTLTSTIVKAKCLKKTDIGTKVDRSDRNEKKSFDIHQLKTAMDIKKFILKESKARLKNLTSSKTKEILSHEWSGATKLFERKIQSGEEKKAINIFKKFIGSKI